MDRDNPAMNTLFLLLSVAADPAAADFIIQGAKIYDGTGKPGFRADVGVENGRIAAIGDLSEIPL